MRKVFWEKHHIDLWNESYQHFATLVTPSHTNMHRKVQVTPVWFMCSFTMFSNWEQINAKAWCDQARGGRTSIWNDVDVLPSSSEFPAVRDQYLWADLKGLPPPSWSQYTLVLGLLVQMRELSDSSPDIFYGLEIMWKPISLVPKFAFLQCICSESADCLYPGTPLCACMAWIPSNPVT